MRSLRFCLCIAHSILSLVRALRNAREADETESDDAG